MYRLNHNQDVIELLLKLKEFEQKYPTRLFVPRRAWFALLIERYIGVLVHF